MDGGGRVGVLVQDVDHDRRGTQVVRGAGVVPGVPGIHVRKSECGVGGVELHCLVTVTVVVDHPVVVVPGDKKRKESRKLDLEISKFLKLLPMLLSTRQLSCMAIGWRG